MADNGAVQNELTLRQIVDGISALVAVLTPDGAVEIVNRQVLDYFGKPLEDMREWSSSDAVHPDDLPGVIALWTRSIESAQPYDIELRQRGADGVYRWFHAQGLPVRDAEGRILRWFVLQTDVDERKRNEAALTSAFEELAKSEAELRTIIDAIPQLIVSLRADGTFLSANRAVLDYTGLTKEEVRTESFGDVFHPKDTERLRDQRVLAISKGVPFEYERRVRRKDGQYRWFLIQYNPLRDQRGEVIRWYAAGTDIDDRKRAEDALRSNEESLRLTIDSIPGFVSTANAAGEVEFLNRQVLEYFGKTTDEMKQWATGDAVHPDDLPGMVGAYRHAIETGQPLDIENRSRRADGVYRWFHVRARPQRDAEDRIVRWYTLVTDIDERKKAEEKVRRSEEYLTEAQHLSRTGSFGCNVSSGEMFWSDETFRIFGYDRATKPAVEAILERAHPEDKARVQEQILRATREGKDCDLEYRVLLPDDSVKHVHVVAHASKDELGGFEFVGAVMDVTAAKEAEERIRRDERELATTIETIPALVLSFLPDGTVDFVSHRWLDYVGLSREEMFPTKQPLSRTLGGAWKSTNHPDDLDRAVNKWQAALATGEPLELETRYRRADGQYRWFLVRSVPLRDEIGRIVKWYATFTDIDDRKQAEEKRRRSERELRLIFETIPAMVYTMNADGDVELVNERLLTFLGTKTLAFNEWSNFIHADDRARVLEVWKSTTEARESYDVELRLRRSDGVHRWFNSRGTPMRDAEGHVVRWYALLTDIDDRKSAEDALRSTQTRLSRARQVATVAELSASIAHEINQPLASVVTNAHASQTWLSHDPPNVERAQTTLERIIRDGHSAAEVVRRIRALFKEAAPVKELLDMNQIVAEVLRVLSDELRENSIVVETELAADLPRIAGDHIQIQQTVINLVHNATEAMAGLTDRPKSLVLKSQRLGDELLIEVRDHGVGVTDPALVFEPFFTTKESGMGMGLSISRSIVEAHGGRIWATANQDAGTTFGFALPLALEVSG
jgi:PAS domain S-box-containing protein